VNQNGILSIKEGIIIPKFDSEESLLESEKGQSRQGSLFTIEDPFDDVHDPGRSLIAGTADAKRFIEHMEKARDDLAKIVEVDDIRKIFEI